MTDSHVPESWRLAFALDETARTRGWLPTSRATSDDEVTVTYRRRPRHEATSNDEIPGMIDELPE